MEFRTFIMILLCASSYAEDHEKSKSTNNKPIANDNESVKGGEDEPPEGYYAFVESPNAEPPKVRPPPYIDSDKECYDIEISLTRDYIARREKRVQGSKDKQGKGFVSIHNICGDLNKGYIPRNPMNQYVNGSSYPFALIKNHTLKFLSKALPILKADDSLPKVAKVHPLSQNSVDTEEEEIHGRSKRSNPDLTLATDINRNGRKFCENGGGVVCMLYKAIQGEPIASSASVIERRDEPSTSEYRRGERVPSQEKTEYTGPPTPCPAKVEYATPVFAKNYQGVWRYVVQIPYEGYFTQTIELTRCMQSRCHYLDGGCLSSPRWTSLLVAEIFYPDTFLEENQGVGIGSGTRDPVAVSPPPVHDFQNYQQYLQKRATTGEARNNGGSQQHHCDGVDEMGCFQVRLYYDWFLVPGSCKCWRPDYFNRYVRRSSSNIEL